jgi:hypothetical protein
MILNHQDCGPRVVSIVSPLFSEEIVVVRTMSWTLAAAIVLFFAPVQLHIAKGQQQPTSIELNQSLLEKWLVVMPQVVGLGKSSTIPQTDDALLPHLERVCTDAGFDNYDQCGAVIGYVGMIVSTCDRRNRTFHDPIVMMRREIARIEADASLSPEGKDEATAELKHIVAGFPNNIPEAHLRLMTANRDRIFAVLATTD